MWRFESETFSGTVVETMHGEFNVLLGDVLEGHLLREELADEAIHILVGAALPGGIGMGEEEVSAEFLGDPLMLSELLSIVGRERMNVGCKRRQQRDHGIGDRLRRLERHMGDQRIARRAFIECDQRVLLPSADNQIALPITEAGPLGDDRRAQVDGYLVGNRAAPLASAIAFSSDLLAAQGAVQGTARTLVDIDTLIDGLVADGRLSLNFEVTSNLFRTPGLGQLDLDDRPGFSGNTAAVLTGPHAGL